MIRGGRPMLALGGRFVAENMPAFLGRRPPIWGSAPSFTASLLVSLMELERGRTETFWVLHAKTWPGRGSAGGNGLEVAPPSGKRTQGLPGAWRGKRGVAPDDVLDRL
jgi:hypothetical protein